MDLFLNINEAISKMSKNMKHDQKFLMIEFNDFIKYMAEIDKRGQFNKKDLHSFNEFSWYIHPGTDVRITTVVKIKNKI